VNARLEGRNALVTGSTDGIGAAIAQALAAEGAHVIVTGRNAERGQRTLAAIEEAGGKATFIAVDLGAGAAAVKTLADAAQDVDILVNNAAMLITPAPTSEIGEQLIDQALSVNVKAAFLLTGMMAPAMVARGHGSIINIGSISGLRGASNSALYSTTKAAIHSLTKSWAAEYGPAGVRVNTVAPGPTLTERVTGTLLDRLAPMIAAIPTRRGSSPAEVGAAVVFLASDDAANINGATLSVDGGMAVV
jgi:NAD(P)-dependent dehydrogenase (short-subunit alcohol dehydrogenase family)